MLPRCKKCKGNKTVKEKKRLEVVIEKGMADRQRIVLTGEGDEEVRTTELRLIEAMLTPSYSRVSKQATLYSSFAPSPTQHSNDQAPISSLP